MAAPARPFVADASSTWQTDGVVYALANQGGIVYAGGEFASVRPPGAAAGADTTARTSLASFNATTGALAPCAPTLTDTGTVSVRALTVSTDGTVLYVGGRFSTVDGVPVKDFAAIDLASCTVKRGYPRFNNIVYAIGVGAGAVYVGGEFSNVSGHARGRLAAVSPSGSLLSWAPTADARVRALTVTGQGDRVYAGGKFGTIDGQSIDGIVALNPTDGSVAQSFPGWIDTSNQEIKTLAHDATNVYLGSEGTGHGVFDGRIALDAETGQQVWRDNCLGATQAVLPYQGLLYSATHAHDCHTTPGGYPDQAMQGRQHFLAQQISDSTITPWFPDTDEGPGGKGVGPFALTVANGVLWAGGEFTKVNDAAQQGLTRFANAPDVGRPEKVATPTGTSTSSSATVSWRTSWDRDDGTLTYRVYRDGGSSPIYTTTADSRYWSRTTLSFTDQGLAPGSTHSYTVTASDARNTSLPSAPVSIQALTDYVLGSTTSQSSVAFGATSSRAADGNTDGVFNDGSVTHTNDDRNALWDADLGAVRTLTRVVLWNRTDCCNDRLGHFYVFLSQQPFTSTDPDVVRTTAGVTTFSVDQVPSPTLALDASVPARYVRVQLKGSGYLSLAEVQALGP